MITLGDNFWNNGAAMMKIWWFCCGPDSRNNISHSCVCGNGRGWTRSFNHGDYSYFSIQFIDFVRRSKSIFESILWGTLEFLDKGKLTKLLFLHIFFFFFTVCLFSSLFWIWRTLKFLVKLIKSWICSFYKGWTKSKSFSLFLI